MDVNRGEDYMEKLCESLRGHAINKVTLERQK